MMAMTMDGNNAEEGGQEHWKTIQRKTRAIWRKHSTTGCTFLQLPSLNEWVYSVNYGITHTWHISSRRYESRVGAYELVGQWVEAGPKPELAQVIQIRAPEPRFGRVRQVRFA